VRRLLVLGAVLAAAAAAGGFALAGGGLFSPPKQLVEFGYVKSVTPKGKAYELRFDPALWLQGRTANVAAAEDGAIKPGQAVPNDYWIRNPDRRLLTYELPVNAHVTILVNLATTRSSPAELAQLLKGKNPKHRGQVDLKHLGFWLRYSIDTVEALDQQYQP